MSKLLAVIVKKVGGLSETFIRRHVEQLQPDRTVVIALTKSEADAGHWDVNCPQLILDEVSSRKTVLARLSSRVTQRLLRKKDSELSIAKAFLQAHRVEVIMSEYLDASLRWLPLAQALGIPFYAHAHGYDISRCLRDKYWQRRYRQELSPAAGIITMNQLSRQRLIDLGIPPEKIHVIPYGVDVPPQPCQRHPQETVKCLAVGRMVGKKAPILTLDAFRRASERCPNLHLDYIGGGPLLSAARQYILAFGIAEKVTLHGNQSNAIVHQLMQEADMFLQHSMTDLDTGDEEGLPVAILEAMSYALPVVSTKHAGIPEAVSDGEVGLLVDEGDSTGMAEKILELATDGDLRRSFGLAGWERASGHFSWKIEKEKLRDLMGIAG